jgi:hypothetical protein
MPRSSTESISTGVDDATYDLILVLQQALEDCYRYQCCAADADAAGDEELRSFFAELASSDREIAARASRLLTSRLGDEGARPR